VVTEICWHMGRNASGELSRPAFPFLGEADRRIRDDQRGDFLGGGGEGFNRRALDARCQSAVRVGYVEPSQGAGCLGCERRRLGSLMLRELKVRGFKAAPGTPNHRPPLRAAASKRASCALIPRRDAASALTIETIECHLSRLP